MENRHAYLEFKSIYWFLIWMHNKDTAKEINAE